MAVTEKSEQACEKKRLELEASGNGSGAGRAGRDLRVANTRENSTKVYCLSITFLLAFERDRKMLKLLVVKIQVKKPALWKPRTGHPAVSPIYPESIGQTNWGRKEAGRNPWAENRRN